MKVPFGERGLKIRLAAAAGASLFATLIMSGDTLDRVVPGGRFWFWVGAACVGAALFFGIARWDEDGRLEPGVLHAIIPLYLLLPGLLWVIVAGEDEGPSWGYWPVFGSSWSGAALYAVFLCLVAAYNLLRLNLQRWLARPR
jgi:hypothetical protein